MNDGNSWRGTKDYDGRWAPWERVGQQNDDGVDLNAHLSPGAETTHRSHGTCGGCYCHHIPACPPCECSFHNPF